jgi:hypothetical protein
MKSDPRGQLAGLIKNDKDPREAVPLNIVQHPLHVDHRSRGV